MWYPKRMHKRHLCGFAITAALWALPSIGWAMAPEQAYALLRHQQPVFSPGFSSAPHDEAAYLAQFFAIIDQAVVQRVELMTWLAGKGQSDEPFDRYDDLLFQLKSLQAPARLREVQALTREAVEEQRDVIREWRRQPQIFVWELAAKDPRVASSSLKLHQAFNRVITLYPTEHEKNRQAFYDFFCCLDFL